MGNVSQVWRSVEKGEAEFPGDPSRMTWVEFLRPERETELAFVHQPFVRSPQKPLLKLPQALLHSPLTPQGYPKSLPRVVLWVPALAWPCRTLAEFLHGIQPHLLPWREALQAEAVPAFWKGSLVYSWWWIDRASPVPAERGLFLLWAASFPAKIPSAWR